MESPFGGAVWEVLARYLAKESRPGEADAVRQWLAEDPRRGELLATFDRSLKSVAFRRPADLDVVAAWRRLSARRDQPQVLRLPLERKRWIAIGLRVAAVLAVTVLGATALWRRTPVDSEAHPPAAVPQTYATVVGQTDSLRLPDGSRVVLGPASRLTLAADYGSGRRDAELVGEALFDVLHDVARPFTVRAGPAVIQDLGTTFTVRDDEGEVRVVVTSGSVLLQGSLSQRQGVVLSAGDRGTVGRDGEAAAERAAATADDLAWTRGRLVFHGASLPLVIADLRRWYGIELEIADPLLASRHLTASFAGEPPGRVLDIIALALGARVERRGDTAIVRAR